MNIVATATNSIRPVITIHVDTVSIDSYAISITLLLHRDNIFPMPRICAGMTADFLYKTFFFNPLLSFVLQYIKLISHSMDNIAKCNFYPKFVVLFI